MTTLTLEDASPTLLAAIENAKARRRELGITPLEYRPVTALGGVLFTIDPSVPVDVLTKALHSAGLHVYPQGGRYVVRQR